MATAVFHDLNNAQPHDTKCAVCPVDFTLTGVRPVPVGVSGTTDEPVFA